MPTIKLIERIPGKAATILVAVAGTPMGRLRYDRVWRHWQMDLDDPRGGLYWSAPAERGRDALAAFRVCLVELDEDLGRWRQEAPR